MKSIAITLMALIFSNAVLADAEKDIDYRKANFQDSRRSYEVYGYNTKGAYASERPEIAC